jgi:hypothetical protein
MGAGTATVAVLSTVLATATPAPGARAISLGASFVLKTVDPQGTDVVSGALSFMPGGEVCVAVKSPNVQEMHLTPRELTIYYPDRDLAFVAHFEPPQPPPMLDALAAGIVDPASTLPPDSKLIDRKRENGNLVTRWRAVDRSGKAMGEMRAVESRAGALSLEIVDPAGKPQRRFTFGDRVRVGAQSVPRSIVADYFAAGGVQTREEQWSLTEVAPRIERRPVAIGCARLRPQTKIQALSP